MLVDIKDLYIIFQCPITGGNLEWKNNKLVSDQKGNKYVYNVINDYPILIDFTNSILDESDTNTLSSVIERKRYRGLSYYIKKMLSGPRKTTDQNVAELFKLLLNGTDQPNVLIVGGGTIGQGMEMFYEDPKINLVSFDIYASRNVQFLADAHNLPLKSNYFDAVIVQAVLEHVLEPKKVVREIYRVLRPDGLVYAETPFLQKVHEGPYDFTRYTDSGHRYLFKDFSLIKSGVCAGTGTQLLWSIESFVSGIFRSYKIGKLFKLFLFWFKYLDVLIPEPFNIDSANGVYFLGQKHTQSINPKEIVIYYKGVQKK